MRRVSYLIIVLAVTLGWAKPLKPGKVVEASPVLVKTQWPKTAWTWRGQTLVTGEVLANVCKATVPKVGTIFVGGMTTWDRTHHCWQLRLNTR